MASQSPARITLPLPLSSSPRSPESVVADVNGLAPIITGRQRTLHLISEFSHGVAMLDEHNERERDYNIGDLVEKLVVALQSQAQARPTILHYVNLGLLVAVIFGSGIFYQKLTDVEKLTNDHQTKIERISAMEQSVNVQYSSIQSSIQTTQMSMGRLEDRLNRIVDKAGK